MQHEDIWRAIDALAAQRGLSASALARSAGLDPTSFNPSKRRTPDGRLRWPSTESIAKILSASSIGIEAFAALVGGRSTTPAGTSRPRRPAVRTVPLASLAQAGQDGFFDEGGNPTGGGWDRIALPVGDAGIAGDPHAFALTIQGDSMDPVYRDGDIIVVSPASPVRTGDRVVIRTAGGELMARQLLRRTVSRVDLGCFNPAYPPRGFMTEEIGALHRIVWASQ
ncbi:helix-turn-helix transcriptional regulator [Acidiphilium sp.]|uniref:S24 family peptidase n=1 Tax=Acidiphilium sp. TaxID=527 RepID=UPI002588D617|nr:helix-turn-helix transcriptional regulator [Acidiphilium sp.]